MPRARRYTILVTGVGAIIGYGIVRSLRASRFGLRIIGMDIYADAVGRHWCDAFEPAQRADAAGYPEFLSALIRKHSVDLVIPGIEQDLHRMVEELTSPALGGLATRWAMNPPELVRLAADKWAMHQALEAAGMPVIPTVLTGEFDRLAERFGVPFLLKPRCSYAGKGIQLIETGTDLEYWNHKLGAGSFILQRIVGSDDAEFTVAAFGLGDGQPVQQIALRRGLAVDGSTAKARLEAVPELEEAVNRLIRLFHPVGPTNFQFRMHRGECLMLEINPRISSSTSLRTAFGFNEAEMCVEYFLEGLRPAWRELRPGMAERFVDDFLTYF